MTIVFMRNFDAEIEAETLRKTTHGKPNVDEVDIEKIREEAFREGLAQGASEARSALLKEIEADRVNLLAGILGSLQEVMREKEAHEQDLEAQFFDFAISVGEKVMPELIEARSNHRTMAQMRRGLRMALGSRQILIRISDRDHEILRQDILGLIEESGFSERFKIDIAAELEPGDIQIRWDKGSLDYSFGVICQEILEALRKSHPRRTSTSQSSEKRTT